MNRHVIAWGTVTLILLLALGCAPRMAAKQQCYDETRSHTQNLVERWEEYDIYLYEWTFRVPAAILFDLKNDGNTLRVGSGWSRITTRESLIAALERRNVWRDLGAPYLCSITGPDGNLWGYAATIAGTVSATEVDGRTMDISPPREPNRPLR
jgi:hypothetical protein